MEGTGWIKNISRGTKRGRISMRDGIDDLDDLRVVAIFRINGSR